MPDVPPLTYGLVKARLLAGVGDSADPGRTPEGVPLGGEVQFQSTAGYFGVQTATPKAIIVSTPIVAQIDPTTGVLQWNGEDDVPLFPTDDVSMGALGAQYRVTPKLTYLGKSITFSPTSWLIEVPTYDPAANGGLGNALDLLDTLPGQGSTPVVQIVRGPKGDDGTSIVWMSVWDSSHAYAINDAVQYNGSSYICVVATTAGQSPASAPLRWDILAEAGAGTGGGTTDLSNYYTKAQIDTALQGKQASGSYAPLVDAHLTGVPTAPTPAVGTNTTQLATAALVKGSIDALVAGAPGALDTLKEISDQLATDESAVTALTATIGAKYTKPGTGIPTTDLSTATQNTLAKATSALQPTDQAQLIRRYTSGAWQLRGTVPDGCEIDWRSSVSVGPPPTTAGYAIVGVDSYTGEV